MSYANGGPDFHLPDEFLSVIPTDPYDQLDLARKITAMAIASRVSKLESETTRLKQNLHDKNRLIAELEERVSELQHAYEETDLRLKLTRDDNLKLSRERDSLAMTAKKLGRDLTKLERFKRQLMQSLSDDVPTKFETVDVGTFGQSVPKVYDLKDDNKSYTTHNSFSDSRESKDVSEDASNENARFSMTPYLSPRFTPAGTPKIISTSGSPRRYSAAVSPQKTSGATSPKQTQYESQTGGLSSWYPSSQQSSAANSPPHGRPLPARTPRIDGKEFFRQARCRLSYEQFSAFLANIKELNAQKQTREEMLEKAEDIFGVDNKDLLLSFQGLLIRNVH